MAEKPKELNFDKDIAKFTERQTEANNGIDSGLYKFILYGGALGGGKAIDVNTPIATPDGWKPMGEMVVGDKVFSENGIPCNVVWVSDVIREETYKLTFSDGSEIIAGTNHEWFTETNKDRQKLLRRGSEYREQRKVKRPSRGIGKRPDLSEANSNRTYDYLDKPVSTIKTTKELFETLKDGEQTNHAIYVCKALELPDERLEMPPYVLGAWLGDGCSTAGQISGIDTEILDYVKGEGYEVTDHANIYSHGIIGLLPQLKKLGVYNDKHIPTEYLRGSKEQRLLLLQGLMDTDGYCDTRGQCEIQLVNKRLIDDVYELICSLGIKVQIRVGRATLYGKDCGEKYRLKFLTELPVFRLTRKLERQKMSGFRGTHNRRYIVDIQPIEPVPLKCIQVDSPSHLYLAGKSMIPTHNSYWLRWTLVRLLMIYFQKYGLKWVQVMLACEDYPQLKDRQLSKIEREFPPWLGKGYSDHKVYGRCFILSPEYGSGVICFRNLDDPSKYQSAEFAAAGIDELTKNDYDTFTEIRKRLRWTGIPDDECLLLGATNPGGIGHGYCKALWVDKIYPDEFKEPYDYSAKFCYIPAKADDNPHLDEGYWRMLHTLPQHQRAAFRDGSWDTYVGQALQEWSRVHHVIKPLPVPENSPKFMTFDWGFGAPFSVGWWWLDADGRFYRFAEWYGWNGTPNQGLRLADSEIAQGIIKREESMGFKRRIENNKVVFDPFLRFCDPTCLNRKPNYQGGGQGRSTSDEFRAEGLVLRPGDPRRDLKLRQFHQRLLVEKDEKTGQFRTPMMQVYDSCIHFIRTIPNIVVNPNNVEDIDCFVAGTLISTPKGDTPVENIQVGDLVKTPIGNRKVIKAGISGKSERVITVVLSTNTKLTGTANHCVYVKGKGLVELQKLTNNDELEIDTTNIGAVWQIKRLFITVSNIARAIVGTITDQTERISSSAIWSYIDRYIKTIMDLFQKDAIFTTLTTTQTTTPSKTLSPCQHYYMQHIMGNYLTQYPQLEIGQVQNVEKKYCEKTQKKWWKIQKKENFRVEIVELLLRLNILQNNFATTVKKAGERLRRYVPSAVMNILDAMVADINRKRVHIVAVGNYEEATVYKLTVEETHLYYANGILVTNTDGEDHCYDEAALLCMARPMQMSGANKWKDTLEKEAKRPKNLTDIAALERENIFNQNSTEYGAFY
jgi:hypothetical protein